MKKILLFLFMCVSSFLIYENCSALEASEVNDDNILQYIIEKYPEHQQEYYYLAKYNGYYFFTSTDIPIYFTHFLSSGELKATPCHPTQNINISFLKFKISNLSSPNVNRLNNTLKSYSTESTYFIVNGSYSNLDTFRSYFLYSSYDIYGREYTDISDIILIPKTVLNQPEPSPSPEPSDEPEFPPETSAPTDDTGGVSTDRVISIYMKYFLMGLPVALIMVSIEKFIEIFHNFILGKMRK